MDISTKATLATKVKSNITTTSLQSKHSPVKWEFVESPNDDLSDIYWSLYPVQNEFRLLVYSETRINVSHKYFGIHCDDFAGVFEFVEIVDSNDDALIYKFRVINLIYGSQNIKYLNSFTQRIGIIDLERLSIRYSNTLPTERTVSRGKLLYTLSDKIKLFTGDTEHEINSIVYSMDSTGEIAFYQLNKHLVFPYGKFVKANYDSGNIEFTTEKGTYTYNVGLNSVDVLLPNGNHKVGKIIKHTGELIKNSTIYDVIIHNGEYYIDSGINSFNSEANVTNLELFSKLDYDYGWVNVGVDNKYVLNDLALDTVSHFNLNEECQLNVGDTCEFDFVAIRNFYGEFTINVLDSTNTIVETHDISSNPPALGTYYEYTFYGVQIGNNKCTETTSNSNATLKLDLLYNNTYSLQILSTHPSSFVGGVFLGLSMSIPCISIDTKVRYRLPKELNINPISQLREISPLNGLRFKETSLKFKVKEISDALQFTKQLSDNMESLVYLNAMDEFAETSHGGFLETVEVSQFKEISIKLKEYNNS